MRQLVGRQVENQRISAQGAPQRLLQGQPDDHHEQDRDQVHREDHVARMVWEEHGGEHDVDREAGGA